MTASRFRKTKAPAAPETPLPQVDPFRARHLALSEAAIDSDHGRTRVLVDEAESPLVWLARRRGSNGKPLVEPHQLLAGERLRADFTLANLMPRTTSNWESPLVSRRGESNGAAQATDAAVAARQRVHHALDAAGAEFSGLLLDVCCFLKRLEDIERERKWPPRSAKVVLQLGLDRLARHYGFGALARGRARAAIQAWNSGDRG